MNGTVLHHVPHTLNTVSVLSDSRSILGANLFFDMSNAEKKTECNEYRRLKLPGRAH